MMIHTGVDERDYWYAAKALSQGLPFPAFSHRTVRWAIILPVALLQKLLGTHPNVYYVAPLLNALAQTLLLYLFGKRIRGRFVGILSAVMLIFFPYQIRAASQVRPEIFSITYMLLCAYLLVLAMDEKGRRRLFLLVGSSLILFLAYETKITNLFFLPGIFLALLLFGGKTGVRDCFAFGLPLLILFLGETALYSAFTEFRFGQLSIITANHLSSDYADPLSSYWQVFLRYSPEYLQPYWQIPLGLFAGAGAYYLVKGRSKALTTLILTGFSFIFFITFTVTKLDPIMVAEDFINRYFCALLPFAFLVISWAVQDAIGTVGPGLVERWDSAGAAPFAVASLTACLAVSALFSLPVIPASVRQYAHTPLRPAEHTFAVTDRYYRTLNEAWENGVPVLSAAGAAGYDAAETVCKYFLKANTEPRTESINGTAVTIVSGTGDFSSSAFIQAVRFPFRITTVPITKIAEIDAERSIQ